MNNRCGCVIREVEDPTRDILKPSYEIDYCGLHSAVLDLLEACRAAEALITSDLTKPHGADIFRVTQSVLRDAIEKAEGKCVT